MAYASVVAIPAPAATAAVHRWAASERPAQAPPTNPPSAMPQSMTASITANAMLLPATYIVRKRNEITSRASPHPPISAAAVARASGRSPRWWVRASSRAASSSGASAGHLDATATATEAASRFRPAATMPVRVSPIHSTSQVSASSAPAVAPSVFQP